MNFCTFLRLKLTKWTKFTTPKMTKPAVFALLISTKLISRKIWVIQNSWKFGNLIWKGYTSFGTLYSSISNIQSWQHWQIGLTFQAFWLHQRRHFCSGSKCVDLNWYTPKRTQCGNFSATHILHEITFGVSRSSKTAIFLFWIKGLFAILEGRNSRN